MSVVIRVIYPHIACRLALVHILNYHGTASGNVRVIYSGYARKSDRFSASSQPAAFSLLLVNYLAY